MGVGCAGRRAGQGPAARGCSLSHLRQGHPSVPCMGSVQKGLRLHPRSRIQPSLWPIRLGMAASVWRSPWLVCVTMFGPRGSWHGCDDFSGLCLAIQRIGRWLSNSCISVHWHHSCTMGPRGSTGHGGRCPLSLSIRAMALGRQGKTLVFAILHPPRCWGLQRCWVPGVGWVGGKPSPGKGILYICPHGPRAAF